jgi:hypothetical protein
LGAPERIQWSSFLCRDCLTSCERTLDAMGTSCSRSLFIHGGGGQSANAHIRWKKFCCGWCRSTP